MILDSYEREHNYLRISLTDKCNLRCAYCMPNEAYAFMPKQHLMQATEIEEIARVFVSMGVDKIRLTGGEPMARKDFDSIVRRLSALPVELSITTNATLLHRHIDVLKEARIANLNISLDTLSAARYFKLTRRDLFDQTYNNIQLAIRHGFNVKINTVVMKGVNDDEVLDFIRWTADEAVEIRFIEFMPFEGNRWEGAQVFSKQEILELVQTRYTLTPLPSKPHDTSSPFGINGHKGSFAIISTMSNPFCAGCNRMRLTADGKMKNCLFSAEETDLLSAFRANQPIDGLIRNNILGKKEKLGGQFGDRPVGEIQGDRIINRSMISIGG
ncbi:MAG: GTP 3',8-cyclase MoaA [Chitinophagaceae bacterium]|nr:MAG: GTP 3',8-cyclase MoaA [Chitinophagaceae bacterium]